MKNQPKQILRTNIPIIGEATSFREAMNILVTQYLQPNFNGIAQDIMNLHKRLAEVEKSSFRRMNVYINPKEPDMAETIEAMKKAVSDLLEPTAEQPIAEEPQAEEIKDDSSGQETPETGS